MQHGGCVQPQSNAVHDVESSPIEHRTHDSQLNLIYAHPIVPCPSRYTSYPSSSSSTSTTTRALIDHLQSSTAAAPSLTSNPQQVHGFGTEIREGGAGYWISG